MDGEEALYVTTSGSVENSLCEPALQRCGPRRFGGPAKEVQKAAHAALGAAAKALPKEVYAQHVDHVRGVLRSIVSDARYRRGQIKGREEWLLPGFNLPRGLEPLLPCFQHALMNGTAEQRQAAKTPRTGQTLSSTAPTGRADGREGERQTEAHGTH